MVACLIAWATPIGTHRALGDDPAAIEFFEAKIRPLLAEHCYECHSTESGEASGGLRLDTAGASRRGGQRGPAVVPGDLANSRLVTAISYTDPDMEMPPEGKLSDEQIGLFKQWIEMGAADPRQSDAAEQQGLPSPFERAPDSHWAFVPPVQPITSLSGSATVSDPIDAYFQAAAAKVPLTPNPQAEPRVLVERLYIDLTGLRPTADEVNAYLNDSHPLAYQRLVDQLLSSPAFGERFARHWMDVARYADTVGYDFGGKDRRLKGSERYRDWLIRAFGNDMPYGDMVRHQLCGDRTDPKNEHGNLDAMGFLTVGRKFQNQFDLIDDRIDVISRGLLGVTVSCARCHDHKFDPVTAKDYYALAGILVSSEQPADGPSPLMMRDSDKPHDMHVLLRGQPGNHGEIAPRQFLTALRKPDEPRFNDGSGRFELAERIIAPDNPLTYRVMANRIWLALIGKSLVITPSDFGFRTERPAVPEVLDDLAIDLAGHQSIQRLVRRIVMTETYRRSSQVSTAAMNVDPDNRYAMRGNRRRLDFETLRDSMLATAAVIDRTVGGEPVDISIADSRARRSVYAFIDRQNLPGVFRTFDVANPDAHVPERHYTTVPQQSLYLMNSPILIRTAVATADRVTRSVNDPNDHAAWARELYQAVLSRLPTDDELQLASQFLQQPLNTYGPPPDPRRLWQYGTAELNDQGAVVKFAAFKTFKDNRWQNSDKFPDDELGYSSLGHDHGHPGNGDAQAVVRRWTAPSDGTVTIGGVIGHKQEQGDGVRAAFAIGDHVYWREVQKNNIRPIEPMTWPIKAGQSLDMIVDKHDNNGFDSFSWRINVRFEGAGGRVIEANSVDDFSGPLPAEDKAMNRREQLAQVLLLSNEFAFVD